MRSAGVYLTLRWASETDAARDRGVDPAGQRAAVVSLVALIAATIEGGSRGFGNELVLGGYGVFVLAALAFVVIERTKASSMLPPVSKHFEKCAN